MPSVARRLFILFGGAVCVAAAAAAGQLQSPEQYLGYTVGEQFTTHDRVVGYLEHLARNSERVRLFRYGETYEGRPLVFAAVSSEANLARLEELQALWGALADPEATAVAEARQIAVREPALVWLSFNVHGNEASSTEAALLLLHRLASAEDDTTKEIRKNLVVVIDPCLNPDGRERYVNWYRSVAGKRPHPDPDGMEHDEPWPGGRYNHYLFDLNRDWVWQTQRESQARARIFLRWHPQVHVDFHEMGYNSSYFFYPATRPANVYLPSRTLQWGMLFGRENARYFDERGWEYFTEEGFDLFYPGYGDTWPSLQGAIGMTFEQAGHSGAGLVVERRDGTKLRLRDRVQHHFGAAVATLFTAARQKTRLLADYYDFWSSALRMDLPAECYVVPKNQEKGRVRALATLLMANGVRVGRLKTAARVTGALGYDPESGRRKIELAAGSLIVPARQPRARLVATLMEPEVALPDTYFYDITAWCLPLALGLEAYRLDRMPKVEFDWLNRPPEAEGGLLGQLDSVYAFLIPWNQDGSAAVLYRLLEAKARVRVARKDFVLRGRRYGRGTLVVPARQPRICEIRQWLADSLQTWAIRYEVDIFAAPTGMTDRGPDLGSEQMPLLRKPRIAVVTDAPCSPTCYGAIWYLLDELLDVQFTPLRASSLRRVELAKYDVLVFPDDGRDGRGWASALDSTTVERLNDWIRSGGVYIGIKGGAAFATQEVAKLCPAHLKKEGRKKQKEEGAKEKKEQEKEELPKFLTLEQKLHERRLQRVPGTILQAVVDTTHPLGFGYAGKLMTLKTSPLLLEFTSTGHNVVSYPKNARVGGFLSEENRKKIAGTSYLVVERSGSGRVILFADDPNFRLFWRGLTRLFLNAIFFGQIS